MTSTNSPGAKDADNSGKTSNIEAAPPKAVTKSADFPVIRKKTVQVNYIIRGSQLNRLGDNSTVDFIANNNKIGAYLRGTSIGRGLTPEEEKKLLPMIISISPNAPEWGQKCLEYWANISTSVSADLGLPLDCSMEYPNEDAAKQADAEEANELNKIQEARKNGRHHEEIFNVRTSLGTPLFPDQYILYRHCLKYSHVARFKEDMYKSNKIRFYLHSSEEEQAAQASKLTVRKKAYSYMMDVFADATKKENIIYVLKETIQKHNEKATTEIKIDTTSNIGVDLAIDMLANNYPEQFIAICSDEKLVMKAFIERCINANLLRRLPNTEAIIYGDSTNVGNNLNDAVVFLENEQNKEIYQTLNARLKAIK